MAIDLGSIFRFAFNALDENGNPADAGNVTVTVTKPDNTPATPASVPASGTGPFHADYITELIGRHTARATGTNDFAYGPDVFHVRDTAGDIIGLADAKAQLNDAGDDDDEEIRDFLSAATHVVEHLVGAFVRRAVTERHHGGKPSIILREGRAISVTEVRQNGAAVDPSGYSLSDHAVLTRVFGFRRVPWLPGVDNIEVDYTAGAEVTPPNVTLAARLLVQHWWATQRQGSNLPRLQADDVLTIPGVAWSVPIRVTQLLEPDKLAGFA